MSLNSLYLTFIITITDTVTTSTTLGSVLVISIQCANVVQPIHTCAFVWLSISPRMKVGIQNKYYIYLKPTASSYFIILIEDKHP